MSTKTYKKIPLLPGDTGYVVLPQSKEQTQQVVAYLRASGRKRRTEEPYALQPFIEVKEDCYLWRWQIPERNVFLWDGFSLVRYEAEEEDLPLSGWFSESLENYKLFVEASCDAEDKDALALDGFIGELGELMEVLKKHRHHGKPLDSNELILELGDLIWYSVLGGHYDTKPAAYSKCLPLPVAENFKALFDSRMANERVMFAHLLNRHFVIPVAHHTGTSFSSILKANVDKLIERGRLTKEKWNAFLERKGL